LKELTKSPLHRCDVVMLELLRQHLHRKPFQPIRIVMRDGRRHEINDPDKVAIGLSKAFAFLPRMTEISESDIELIYMPRCRRS
jgi:hypothetical protein